jgi:hypothetical protein
VRVTFRAQFAGIKSPGFTFKNPVAVTVEVFRKGDKWLAREASSKNLFKQFEPGVTHGSMKDTVAEHFDSQVSPWAMYNGEGEPLDPKRVEEDPKGNFTLKDMTHVGITGEGSQGKSGANYFNTVCGIEVHVRQLRSVRGSHAPDCQPCREAWEKTKPEDRLK